MFTSVLQDIKASSSLNTPSKVYKAAVTNLPASSSHLPVLQPRNHKQVENYRRKHLQNQRIPHDSLYSFQLSSLRWYVIKYAIHV